MEKDGRIFVAGHKGLAGTAIVSKLKSKGYANIIVKTHKELDLTDQSAVEEFFRKEKPGYVFLAAGKVGGIGANSAYPADFIMENELIQCNVLRSSYKNRVKKLLFLGSCCIYPKACPQPIKEEYLLTGPLEPTNEAYALAKISGLKMCGYYNMQYGTNYIGVVPANLYGPDGSFSLKDSHVVAALMMKMHEAVAKERPFVELWGTGRPLREFLHADDLADACVFLMESYDGNEYLNIGTGRGTSISELAGIIKDIAGYRGELVYDVSKPDGMPRKLLDVSKIERLGWKHRIGLEEGLRETYEFYKSRVKE